MSFLPEASFGLGVLSLPASVRPLVRPWSVTNFVRAITHYPFKLGSPNLDHRCYYPWQKWFPCKRSRSEVKGQGHSGQNPICPFPDCNSQGRTWAVLYVEAVLFIYGAAVKMLGEYPKRFRQGTKVTKINIVSMTTESTHKSNIFLFVFSAYFQSNSYQYTSHYELSVKHW